MKAPTPDQMLAGSLCLEGLSSPRGGLGDRAITDCKYVAAWLSELAHEKMVEIEVRRIAAEAGIAAADLTKPVMRKIKAQLVQKFGTPKT